MAASYAAPARCDTGETGRARMPPPPYFGSLKFPRVRESLRSSTDSDLEAFNHNPTDGSFAPLSFQASA